MLGSEMLGTALLMIGGPGAVILGGVDTVTAAMSFGLTLAMVTAVLGPRSGAHVNPAITLAMLLARRTDGQQAVMAWMGQIAGAVVGGGVVLAAATSRPEFQRGSFFSNGWGDLSPAAYDWPGVLVVEFVVSVMLVTVALTLASDRHGWGLRGVVMGATMAVVALISLPVHNVGGNPARSFGSAIYASTDTSALGMVWMFLLVPFAGSLVGTALWLMIDDTRLEQTGLFTPPLAQARDLADQLVEEVVETVDDVVQRAGRVDHDR